MNGQAVVDMGTGEIVAYQAVDEIQSLTVSEQAELEQHEAVIERGLQTFVEVGNALNAIRAGRLYRERFPTFEAYCQIRWGFGASRARQLGGAAVAVANLQSVTNVTPANEGQVRSLTSLEPEEQRQAWGRAVEMATESGGNVTARHVEQAVEEIREPAEPVEYPEKAEVFHVSKGKTVAREGYGLENIEAAARDCLTDFISRVGISAKSPWASGLTGRVFAVPAHDPHLGVWAKLMVTGYEAETIHEAVLVMPARTWTTWWASLRDHVVCLIEGRVEFPKGQGFSLGSGTAVFYLGPNVEAFCKAFYHLGDVWQRVAAGGGRE